MTLRSRLSLFFVAIVVIPLAGASISVAAMVPSELAERSAERLRGAASAINAVRAERLESAARDVARIAHTFTRLSSRDRIVRLQKARDDSGVDFLAIGRTIVLRPGLLASQPASVFATAALPGGATLRGGWLVDDALASRYARAGGTNVRIFSGSRLLAAAGHHVPTNRRQTLVLPVDRFSIELSIERPHSSKSLSVALAGIGGLGLLVACAIGFALARAITQPLSHLAHSAEAIAAGDYSNRVDESGNSEIAQLGRSFNKMVGSVQAYVQELRDSRDELRRTLERLGATLRSTRGMDEMLRTVLEASAAALGANAGALFRLTPDGVLGVETTIGLEAAQATRDAAEHAVHEQRPILAPALNGLDPFDRMVAAVPLMRGDVVVGAIAIAGNSTPQTFGEYELATLASFAIQASVAIDNVFLREEAQRMALTDPLTSVSNRRALKRKLEREVERGRRYGRPVSIIMCDLDHFKQVNDRFGHLEGDRVLIEAARRITSSIRQGIDVVARYGGEEFVVVLPETSAAGALTVARKIVSTIGATPFAAGDGVRVTMSVGVATVPGDGPSRDELLHAADLALYQAKQEGRNRVVATASVVGAVHAGGNL